MTKQEKIIELMIEYIKAVTDFVINQDVISFLKMQLIYEHFKLVLAQPGNLRLNGGVIISDKIPEMINIIGKDGKTD